MASKSQKKVRGRATAHTLEKAQVKSSKKAYYLSFMRNTAPVCPQQQEVSLCDWVDVHNCLGNDLCSTSDC